MGVIHDFLYFFVIRLIVSIGLMMDYPAICSPVEVVLYPPILGIWVRIVLIPHIYYTFSLHQGYRVGYKDTLLFLIVELV